MSTMTYKGYAARIDYDDRDDIFVGHVLGVRDTISFHGDTVGALRDDFQNAVDHYLKVCAKQGQTPDKPYSGKLMLRVPPEVHAGAALAAEAGGESLNQWAAKALSSAIGLSSGAPGVASEVHHRARIPARSKAFGRRRHAGR